MSKKKRLRIKFTVTITILVILTILNFLRIPIDDNYIEGVKFLVGCMTAGFGVKTVTSLFGSRKDENNEEQI